jgi:hypothetical protein
MMMAIGINVFKISMDLFEDPFVNIDFDFDGDGQQHNNAIHTS